MGKKGKALFLLLVILISASGNAVESKKGTEAEAKVLLERAVNLMRIDEVMALTMMTLPGTGFHYKDLYPFCLDNKGVLMAHPSQLGRSLLDVVTEDGVKVAAIMLKNAQVGKINKITYVFPRVREGKESSETAKKTSFFTRVGNHVCASGFYE